MSLTFFRHDPRAVAVIGAGPGGLAAAAWLKRAGFRPTVFEAASRLGGQWNAGQPLSGVWPGMRANTSRVTTAFSDLDHAPGTPVFPAQEDVLAYLERYARQQDLTRAIRLDTRVERVARDGAGWLVASDGPDGRRQEVFARVVVASGRYNAPRRPDIPGLSGFTGAGGVIHSFDYQGAAAHRGRDVLVAGCSISALEIACELAQGGARSVTLACRRMRWIAPKLVRGVPNDLIAFTRFAAIAGATLPPSAFADALKAMILDWTGSPAQVGAPAPDADVFAAGLALSQNFLPLVAEGRIRVRPWIERIEGHAVAFTDHAMSVYDAIVLGTGYDVSLPFLDDETRSTACPEGDLRLHGLTFHPDLPGLAFLGLYPQAGPYFPTLELQARWIAYAWSGAVPMPSEAQMRAGLDAVLPPEPPMHLAAAIFAAGAGVEPDPRRHPALEHALMLGPLSPVSYRLSGPDPLPDAPERTLAAAHAFRHDTTPAPGDAEKLALLRTLRTDAAA
ncbi:flavin-containing monooxygenase [Jannaschia formosa]|uniref:flavin-containing monooxygenase n=1 Tax=Jannaschia formosa TaxID=2259592 RepID=UPI000E1BA86A|nr:NAD(P)-binding domain-containing protein [Jannaschia formosa]